MKTIINKMEKLLKTNTLKNNVNCKKAISGLFAAVVLLTILTGNSAFISAGIGQTLEKTKLALLEALPMGEEITAVKISTPSRNMIREADREIHMNMNAMIKALNSFHIAPVESNTADHDINEQFYQGAMISLDWNRLQQTDIRLTTQFEAENIHMDLDKQFLDADNQLFNQFYLNNYSKCNPLLITTADVMITDTFYAENN